MEHCSNNKADRELGTYWEWEFCKMAATVGMSFTPMQIGHKESAQAYSKDLILYTLPDITIWTFPGQHHEIKHKDPTRFGTFGLEVYRFNALRWFAAETQQDVMYTIHNHRLAGGREIQKNNTEHWFTADILDLDGKWEVEASGFSWVNGCKQKVPIYYWKTELWKPLTDYWASMGQTH